MHQAEPKNEFRTSLNTGTASYPKARNLKEMTHETMMNAKQGRAYDVEPMGLGGVITETRGLSQQQEVVGFAVPKFNVTPYNVQVEVDNHRYWASIPPQEEADGPQPVLLNDKGTMQGVTDPKLLPKTDTIRDLRNYEREGLSNPNYHQTEILGSSASKKEQINYGQWKQTFDQSLVEK